MTTRANKKDRIDAAELKRRAAGRWPQLIPAVTDIPADVLDGRHHPCPKCGGTDRFRALDDFTETGATICNQCFSEGNGDGLAAIMHFGGLDFPATLRKVADFLGSGQTNGDGGPISNGKKPADVNTLIKGIKPITGSADALLAIYCRAKPPITAAGIRQCGGTLALWNGYRCMRLEGRAPIDAHDPTAIVLCRVEGEAFPAVGKVGERKTHTTRGSVNSWLVSGDVTTATTILDVEGVTDLLAVADKMPAGWVAVTNTAGAKARGKLPRPWASGKKILVAGDVDAPGLDGQHKSAAAYHKAGGDVSLAELPYPVEKDHGRDLRDYLNDDHKVSDLPTRAVTPEDVAAWSKSKRARPAADGPEIEVGPDESRVVDEAIAALAPLDNIYQRGGNLVQVVEGADAPRGIARPKDAPRIALLRHARLRELMADAASWQEQQFHGEWERVHPPKWAVEAVEARGQWQGIPRLEAVVESPVLRADGTILQAPGYDQQTGLIFRPETEFPPAKEKPTQADALAAVKALLEVVEDFPFQTEAHRAAWLAATLTPVARYAFHGPAPLNLFDANVRGCGKSLLTDATSQIVAGREMARMSLPRDDEEFRKRITALAVAGEPLILIDNSAGTLGSPSLDAALTATSWSDRILGQTAMASNVPLFATWYATGNNVILAADTARRTLHIRLESPEESPEERSGFRHADLLKWVRAERARLATAAVTILAAYCAAGRPGMKLKPWGSFEAWSALVREAVVWAGLPDPAATRTELTSQADREAVALRQLVAGWEEIDPTGNGLTVAELISTLAEHTTDYATVRAALWELCPPRDGRTLNPRSIGMKLHHLRRRVVDGKSLDRRDDRAGAIWRIAQPEGCGTNGTSGTKPNPPAHGGAHARAGAGEKAGSSPASVASPAECPHTDVEETPTFDGYVNRRCRSCGHDLPCRKNPIAPVDSEADTADNAL